MRKQKDTSTSLSASSLLCSEQVLQKLSTLEDLLKKKDDKPLTFKEACAYLGYAPSYLYKLTYRKVIPHYKPTGKMIFFSKAELDEWVYKNRCQNSEISSQNGSSTSLGVTNENEGKIKDPNQIEMFRKAKGNSEEAIEKEIVIEFPLKSRRRKEL